MAYVSNALHVNRPNHCLSLIHSLMGFKMNYCDNKNVWVWEKKCIYQVLVLEVWIQSWDWRLIIIIKDYLRISETMSSTFLKTCMIRNFHVSIHDLGLAKDESNPYPFITILIETLLKKTDIRVFKHFYGR